MLYVRKIALLSALYGGARADDFNYRSTQGDNYGPNDWNKVRCGNLETCVSRGGGIGRHLIVASTGTAADRHSGLGS